MTKISDKKVADIKAAIAAGMNQPQIAKKFKVSRSIVSDIATGRDGETRVGTAAMGAAILARL